jgi:signal transduction histidine kinase
MDDMRFRTWPLSALALGALLVLVVVSVLEASRRAQEIYTQLDGMNLRYHDVEGKLRRLRSDVNLSGIWVRDYLLDTSPERASRYRERLAEFKSANGIAFIELESLLRTRSDYDQRLVSLRGKLEEYWQVLGPLFDWTPAEKATQSFAFLRSEVIPRREAVLAITEEIENLNRATFEEQRREVTGQHEALRSALYRLLWSTVALGLIVAATAVFRLRRLEQESERERLIAEGAERRMRELSQQLVATQEEERKHLSRELHDHVGQVLTALRMELGSIDRLRAPDDAPLARAVSEARQLVDSMVRTVRDLSLGLRPSMLDDFGLQAALEWHVRDFTRRYGLRVDLTVTSDLQVLSERHRLCVYRAVQEALTNCARHSSATCVRISVQGADNMLSVAIVDDGIGIEPERRNTGLGLRGIEERVRDLGGTLDIHSTRGVGTSITLAVPVMGIEHQGEATIASAAG